MIFDFTCCFSHRSHAHPAICISRRITSSCAQSAVVSSEKTHEHSNRCTLIVRSGGRVRGWTGRDASAGEQRPWCGSCRARVLIMFFQNKWAFRWARRWRRFHGVPRNHGNPVTPLSGYGVSLPGRGGYLRQEQETREGRNAAVTLPRPFDYPCSFLSSVRSSSSGRPRRGRKGEEEGNPIKINNSRVVAV